ncbi:MAG: phosphonopyruvate decarboxylase [Lachnospiraceae bacterium]|nr:phosphonopyruvate decarboxylase [Lachnospiraceae bacterium]
MLNMDELFAALDSDFYTGVPDSQLKELCNYLMGKEGISNHHIIAANEGNAVGLAAGYYLSTGKVPVVYMQNSGIGNTINPVASLLNPKVYGIPCIFIIGWRGEPGVHDEPQHIFQGEITTTLMETMDIAYFVLEDTTSIEEVTSRLKEYDKLLAEGKSVAFIVKKKVLRGSDKIEYRNNYSLKREDAIEKIVEAAGEDIIVSTTGKASRELFEIRERKNQSHKYDFLTVGSMGHSSSIALGIALNKPQSKVWCIDGDGAAIMHMGSMAVMGSRKPGNVVHIVINNEAHETVGGMPTVSGNIDFVKIADACGYVNTYTVTDITELESALDKAKQSETLSFIEVKCCLFSRENLGRPTTTAKENKENFMNYLKECR